MASLTKPNETIVAPFYKNGVTLQFFQIDFGTNMTGLLDTDYATYPNAPRSPVAVALEAVQAACSIEIIGTLDATGGTGQGLRFAVAAAGGAFGTAKWDGTNSEAFYLYLESLIRAAGTHQGADLDLARVTEYTF